MRELGLHAESIRLMTTSTDKVPNTSATAASSGADLNGAAVAAACVILRERLTAVAARCSASRRRTWNLRTAASASAATSRTAAVCQGLQPRLLVPRQPRNGGLLQDTRREVGLVKSEGRPFHYFACGAAVAEVEVDGFSGMHRVRRVDIVHDVGDSLNPGVDRGQIEGGFVQGMGWLTREELRWDKQGRLLTHSASTYQIPRSATRPSSSTSRCCRRRRSRTWSTAARPWASRR